MVLDCFLLLDVDESILVDRVTGRRTDPETGAIYLMTTKPPETKEIADRLVQRNDDTADKIKLRYREFKNHIDEIKACYEDKMVCVDGAQAPEVVSECIVSSTGS